MSSNNAMGFQSANTSYNDHYLMPEPPRGMGMGLSSMPEVEMLPGGIFPECLEGMPNGFGAGPERFKEADAPPFMPVNPLFRLETTTVRILPDNTGGFSIGDV